MLRKGRACGGRKEGREGRREGGRVGGKEGRRKGGRDRSRVNMLSSLTQTFTIQINIGEKSMGS